jgi:hypothetical protein
MIKFDYHLSMRKLYNLFISVIFLSHALHAQTWSEDVASIIYNNCSSCHRPGGIGPMSLMSYNETYAFRSSIKSAVQSRHMPPWPPDPSYTKFTDQRVLSAGQISAVVNWVNNGAPRGNTTNEPQPPTELKNNLGTPDKTMKMPDYVSKAQDKDVYMCFVLPSDLTQDKMAAAIEVIPGNASIVHHVLVYQDTTSQKRARLLDQQSAEPGYISFGGIGVSSAILLDAWVPGSVTRKLPTIFGRKLYKNSDIVIQVHYPAGSEGLLDSTKVRLYYNSNQQAREVSLAPILNHSSTLTNGPLFIPANTIKTFEALFTTPQVNATVLSVSPHMHLIGESIKVWGNKAGTNDTIPLIDIPHWDFHWQGSYVFQKPVILPPLTKLRARAIYNNTNTNPHNPSFPPVNVSLGEETNDEMMLVYFAYTLYQPGDENIILDSTLLITPVNEWERQVGKLQVFPNPVSSYIQFMNPEQHEEAIVSLWDMTGRKVMERKLSHQYFVQLPTNNLPNGLYRIYLKNNKGIRTSQILIRK